MTNAKFKIVIPCWARNHHVRGEGQMEEEKDD